jgi:uncharacterized membrane protein YtjA (UPF0391 family)
MLYWAAVFFIIALIAAVFGFGGIAVGAASIAKILFFVFLVLFIVSLLFGGLQRVLCGATFFVFASEEFRRPGFDLGPPSS